MEFENLADCVDGRPKLVCNIRKCKLLTAYQPVQLGDVDARRVTTRQVQAAEKFQGWLPREGFVGQVVVVEELSGSPV